MMSYQGSKFRLRATPETFTCCDCGGTGTVRLTVADPKFYRCRQCNGTGNVRDEANALPSRGYRDREDFGADNL
jgi:DnaJ-class molecular chaperone